MKIDLCLIILIWDHVPFKNPLLRPRINHESYDIFVLFENRMKTKEAIAAGP